MKFLTDEEYNALFDKVAENENLTPEQMDALTAMRNDMYERMAYMKDNDSYRGKYDDLERKYRERWNDERKGVTVKKEAEEDEVVVSYETLFDEKED